MNIWRTFIKSASSEPLEKFDEIVLTLKNTVQTS